jgi:cyclic pyranopterin phosphate synthase
MGEMTKPEIREAYREVVASRVPYYGEYLVRDDDEGWVINDDYIGGPPAADSTDDEPATADD